MQQLDEDESVLLCTEAISEIRHRIRAADELPENRRLAKQDGTAQLLREEMKKYIDR